MSSYIHIRPASASDHDALWAIIEPTLRAAETYTLPRDWTRDQALDYWCAAPHQVFVANLDGVTLGNYFLGPNRMGGGSHVANCGFMTAPEAAGRGIASAMCTHALETAREQGYRAMQFNSVVATNVRAVALWQRFGFDIVGRLPGAFHHPSAGFVDLLVMYRPL